MPPTEPTATAPSRRPRLSIQEVDRLVARYVWLERRRFEVLGSWVTSVPEPEVAALLATQAHHPAWHASLWERHLPRRSGYRAPTGPAAGPALSALVDAVAEPSGPDATVVRLVGAYRVLGRHAEADYAAQLARATTVSDAAFSRTCRLVLDDQRADGLEGERVLQALLATEGCIEGAALHQVGLERRLVDAGGLTGPA
jgi:hypothetical protein